MKKIVATVAVAASLGQSVMATELAGWHWPERTLHISTGDLMSTSVGGGINWDSVFISAAARWNNTDAPFLITTDRLTRTQDCTFTAPNTAYFSFDACGEDWPSQVVGVTVTWSDASNEALQTSVLFNRNESWGAYNGPPQQNVEFARVAVHELGHAIGLGHTNDDRAIMFPVGTSVIVPTSNDVSAAHMASGVGKLARVNDANASGFPEVATLRARQPGYRGWVQTRDINNGQYVQSMYFSEGVEPVDLFVLDDMDNDGVEELAVFGRRLSDGRARLEVRGADDRNLISAFYNTPNTSPVAGFAMGRVNGNNTQDVGLLITSDVDGRALVQVREPSTGQHIGNVYFAPGHAPITAVSVPDINNNGATEIAALLVSRVTRLLRLEVRDGLTGGFISLLPMPANYSGLGLVPIDNIGGSAAADIAVLIVSETTGDLLVRVHDGGNGALLSSLIWTTGTAVLSKDPIISLSDISGNGVPEIGILMQRFSDNQPFVQVRDAMTGSLVRLISLGPNSIAQALANLGDTNNDGSEEVGVLGFSSSGRGRVRVYDAQTGGQVHVQSTAPVPGTNI